MRSDNGRPNFATSTISLARPIPSRIYLTGMPGSGKTAVGRPLATRLGYRFLDLDDEVARLAGRSVADLFREGEATFRAAELGALEETTRADAIVVATGGGALVDRSALDMAMRAGMLIYLRASVATLVERLEGDDTRPLLLDEGGDALPAEDLHDRLGEMLFAREPAYHRADLVIDADQGSPETIASSIATRLGA